ncbi:MAG TPA: hypothetical protein VNV35_04640 [Puia sp.]|nr:hypothetical protein [Puia sp.]
MRAQLSSDVQYVPNYLLPSPNAAALMKFSDVPVSPYTGTADITVPIYTIHAKGIDVPVSLDYHTGGIRLKEEASSEGLGWALNAGGMISRTIMNYDDFGAQGYPYFTTAVPQLSGDISITQPAQANDAPLISPYFFDFYCNYNVNTTQGTENFWWAFQSGGTQYDMEPDIFSYNFPGHSGKFILTRAGQAVLQKQDNIQIQFQGMSDTVTFTITDDQGNKFYFNTIELSHTGSTTQISSWYLSKILTQQQDSVTFSYLDIGSPANTRPDYNQTYNYYCGPTQGLHTSNPATSYYDNQALQTINFANGQLQFLFDQNRSDLQNGLKLDSVILYSKNSAGSLTYQHEHDFYYSYFNQGVASTDTFRFYRLKLDSVKERSASGTLPPYSFIYNNPNPGSVSQKDTFSIDHWGYYNGMPNSQLIPSMGIAYAPVEFNNFEETEFLSYPGANREPNLEYMQTFSLQQINYPTGGSTVFQYQANDYDFVNSSAGANTTFQTSQIVTVDSILNIVDHGTTSGTIDLSNIFPLLSSGSPQNNVSLDIAFRYQINDTFPYKNSSHKIYFTFTGPGIDVVQDISGATCDSGSPVCTVNVPITITTPGVYTWSGYIDSAYVDTVRTFAEIHVAIQDTVLQQTYNLLENNSFISPAAGLRIQSITNYKDPTTIASEKVYTYGYSADKLGTGTPQQYSYGRLMSFPVYVNYAFTRSGGNNCTQISLFGSSYTSLTSAIQGNIVGYDQVTETSIDPVTGLDNGMTVYSYYNSNDSSKTASGYGFPGTLNMGYNLDGMLKSKVVYADNDGVYSKLTETDNYYHTTNRIVYYSPKYTYNGNSGEPMYCTPNDSAASAETLAIFYPSIKSERILLDSTINIVYQQGNTANFVTTRNANYYDNPVHYQVTRAYTYDSKGDTLVTKLKYPQDYIPNDSAVTHNTILDSMIGRNMVSETIEKQDSLYYPGSSAGYITGAQLSLYRIGSSYNTIVPDKTYKLANNSPVTNFQPFAISGNTTSLDSRYRQMISFDQYDSYNNLQQYTPVDQNSVDYIWDYLHVYPIAQVKNAALADVAATSFEADGTGNWTYSGASTADTTCITGSFSYNLGQSGGNITKSGLTSGTTYVLSYWTKNSSYLSIAGTISGYPIKGKTIRGWTYYEHKLTGQTSLTISGTGYIDELRLYPATAQMTTYTYSPLVGTTTACDVDNKVTYYFYDGFGRLVYIKDQDGNILKTIQYHYMNQ